jgi:hypothetical protein
MILTRPEQLHAIFKDSDKHKKAAGSDSGYFMSRILGHCLGLMAGQRWKFLKGIVAPPFMHPAAVKSISRVQKQAREHIYDLEAKGDLRYGRIHPIQDLKMLPFFIVAESNYGTLSPEMKSELYALAPARENLMKFVLFGGLARFHFSRFLPTQANRQLQRFRSQWQAFNRAAYERAKEKQPSTLVVKMYDAVHNGSLTEEQVAQNPLRQPGCHDRRSLLESCVFGLQSCLPSQTVRRALYLDNPGGGGRVHFSQRDVSRGLRPGIFPAPASTSIYHSTVRANGATSKGISDPRRNELCG